MFAIIPPLKHVGFPAHNVKGNSNVYSNKVIVILSY